MDGATARRERELFPGRWLAATRELQEQAYGVRYDRMAAQPLVTYLSWNQQAAVAELVEALDETDWKPWSVTQGARGVNRDAFIGELVDVLHFVANMLVAVGCDDAELDRRYAAKMSKNRARQASGTYDGVRGKCPRCRRALDDSAVLCDPAPPEAPVMGYGYCAGHDGGWYRREDDPTKETT